MRRSGQPMTATSTGTSLLASAAIEPNSPIVPTAIRSSRAPTLPGSPSVPTASAVAASASAASPAISERRPGWLRGATDSRRLTAGATRPARAAGTSAATSVTPMPTITLGRSVAGVIAIGTSGIVRPDRVEERDQAGAQRDAERRADERGDGSDDEALEQHRGQRLAPGGAEAAQERELPHTLGDGDRERVVDDEGADEQGDAAERQQDVAEDVDEAELLVHRALDVIGGRLDPQGDGRLQVRCLDAARELGRRDPVVGAHADRVDLARAVEDGLRGAQVEDRDRRAGRADVAELHEADDAEARGRVVGRDADAVADADMRVGGGEAVDRDLALVRPAAGDEAQAHQAGLRDGDADLRRPVDAERLAVAVDEGGGALHLAAHRGDAGDAPDVARRGSRGRPARRCRGRPSAPRACR